MASPLIFQPQTADSAAQNMAKFVSFCRNELAAFGKELEFDDASWNVTDFFPMRGMNHQVFLRFSEHAPKRRVIGPPMEEPFASQCKAIVRYRYSIRPLQRPPTTLIIAFRAVYEAFRDKGMKPDLSDVDGSILDHAVKLAQARKGGDHGARLGAHLGPVSSFLSQNRLALYAPIHWRHGIAWESTLSNKIGKGYDKQRASRLPAPEALRALPQVFAMAKEPSDIIAASVMALLACAPSRINEVFGLPVDCEVSPANGNDKGYYLRWSGSKGHHDFLKGIPAVMSDVAREALANIKKITSEPRQIAKWYEDNPKELYLHADCARLRGKPVTAHELAEILGYGSDTGAYQWAKKQNIVAGWDRNESGRRIKKYNFAEVEKAILSFLPKGFPIFDPTSGLRYSEALLVVRRSQFADWPSLRCMIAPVTHNNIHTIFGRPDGIFLRFGLCSPENPIVLLSHQLRHYLNTLAQKGGLTEAQIAAWSGRTDVRQNAVYDHRSTDEMLEYRRELDSMLVNPTALKNRSQPVSREAAALETRHGHATELGLCEHDFASAPCSMFLECLHCTKHVCVKRDDGKHLARVTDALKHARRSLTEAEQAKVLEYDGAEEWVNAHMETISRLEQLETILSDPDVPDGSVIRLSKSGRYSLVEQAMHDHGKLIGIDLFAQSSDPKLTSGS